MNDRLEHGVFRWSGSRLRVSVAPVSVDWIVRQMLHGLDIDPVNHWRHKGRMETRVAKAGLLSMRHLAGMVLLCALLLRGMIPGGYMPDFGMGEATGFLVVCSGAGGLTIVDPDGGQVPPDTHQDGLCAFAMLANALPLLAAIVLLLWLSPRTILYRIPRIMPGSRRLACTLPAARAPPGLA